MMNMHPKLKTTLVIAFSGFWFIGSLILGIVFYKLMANYVEHDIRNRLKELAGHAAMVINPDEHARLRIAQDQKDSIYTKSVQRLRAFRNLSKEITFIYTARLVDNKVMFVLDAEEDSSKVSHLGDFYEIPTKLLLEQVHECTAPVVETTFYSDKWGTFLSGYAPIRTADGKLDGVIGIDLSLQTVVKLKHKILYWTICVILALLVIALFVAIAFAKSIGDPIKIIDDELCRLASGDLTMKKTDDYSKNLPDEIKSLFSSKKKLHESFLSFMDNINKTVLTLVSSSRELFTVSTQIAANAEELNRETSSVASATEQATTNVESISTTAGEMSSSANNVATTIEEMSASLNEVTSNCQKELKIAAEANTHAKNSRDVMSKLGEAAKSIGKVVEVINAIASRINLLALNATIEASHAGEAGKGFAVVANEVKELSKQTAQATQQIQDQVAEMQANTESAVNTIQSVSSVIEEVNDISQTIVIAVEEQSKTINEIFRNVSGVSSGADEVSKNVAESAIGLAEISSNIAGANNAVADTAKGILQVKTNAEELSKLSDGLKELVGQFKF